MLPADIRVRKGPEFSVERIAFSQHVSGSRGGSAAACVCLTAGGSSPQPAAQCGAVSGRVVRPQVSNETQVLASMRQAVADINRTNPCGAE